MNFSDDQFPSDLSDNGTVGWSRIETASDGKTIGPITFPSVRWKDNGHFYGWTVSQYVAYMRGTFELEHDMTLSVQCLKTGYFSIDNVDYSGDWYAYNVTRHIIRLEKGKHEMRIKAVNEVRIFGGFVPPAPATIICEMEEVPDLVHSALRISGRWTIPDLVQDINLPGMASVGIQNMSPYSIRIVSTKVERDGWGFEQPANVLLRSGQHRPVRFQVLDSEKRQDLTICYEIEGVRDCISDQIPRRRQATDVFKFTFYDLDGTVQYAMAKKPRKSLKSTTVILALHGAGVEADAEMWTSSIDEQEDAWVVFPTGRTPWGYDWHGPSARNAFRAVEALFKYAGLVNPSYIYAGHSNGGQGVWHLSTHYPDALGVVAIAGFASIEEYVPYTGWLSWSYTDPMLKGWLLSSLAEYNADLHVSNLKGMQVHVKTGANDDNVPPMQSRKLHRLAVTHGVNSTLVEVPNKNHWYDDIMRDYGTQVFLEMAAKATRTQMYNFTLTVVNPGEHGGKNGIVVDQMGVPFRVGKIDVYVMGKKVVLQTSNIRRLHVEKNALGDVFEVDGTVILAQETVYLFKEKGSKTWQIEDGRMQWKKTERHVGSYGPIQSILKTDRPLKIVIGTMDKDALSILERIGQTLAHDWYLYGNGDSEIVYDTDINVESLKGNVIQIGGNGLNRLGDLLRQNDAIQLSRDGINLGALQVEYDQRHHPDSGIMMIQPTIHDANMVIIHGTSISGLEMAAKIFPKRTGMPVPDFIITSESMRYKGLGGIRAAGYFSNEWEIEPQSVYST